MVDKDNKMTNTISKIKKFCKLVIAGLFISIALLITALFMLPALAFTITVIMVSAIVLCSALFLACIALLLGFGKVTISHNGKYIYNR